MSAAHAHYVPSGRFAPEGTPRSGADCIPVATRRGTTQSRESHPYGVPLLTAALHFMNKAIQDLLTIPGVGKSIARDLLDLGVRQVEDLKKRDPERLYHKLIAIRGRHVDRCALYVFRCAVYFASEKQHDPELLTAYPQLKENTGLRDYSISFRWGGDMAECACVLIASAALAKSFGALVYYPDDNLLYSYDDLVREAKQALEEMK